MFQMEQIKCQYELLLFAAHDSLIANNELYDFVQYQLSLSTNAGQHFF